MLYTIALFTILSSLGLSIIVWSLRNGISPMPTTPRTKRVLFAAIPKEIKGTLIELGSGWGTLAFPLAKQFPACRIIAYENSPIPYLFSKLRHKLHPLANLQIYRRDFFTSNLTESALIICYLYPGAMQSLQKKFARELKPGTLLISNTFAIPHWTPLHIYETDDLYRSKIYVYFIEPSAHNR